MLKDILKNILEQGKKDLLMCQSLEELESIKIKYLSRKSELMSLSKNFSQLKLNEKKEMGNLFNFVKNTLIKTYEEQKQKLDKISIHFDPEHPGKKLNIGREHLFINSIAKIRNIFINLGFNIYDYRQIVNEKENFDYLNIPRNHPARDLWDTLWIEKKNKKSEYLLRTHTTVFQHHILTKYRPPLRFSIIGKVFRYEATDKSHDFEFYQIDALSLSETTNLQNLKYTIEKFFTNFFHKNVKIRFRPSYFPFVEPGLEVDINCIFCHNQKCATCKFTGWIEVAGAGMIHPLVLMQAKIDYKKYKGFAFGIGIDRLIMLKHNINDIRILHSSDLRFINQF